VDESLQDVRREIERTRVALGEKVSRLEQKIQTTKNTTLNPAYHVRTRPWSTLGTTVAAGFVLGRIIKARSNHVEVKSRTKGTIAPAAGNIVTMIAADFLRNYFAKRRSRRGDDELR
jgi:hypothetical protein